MPYPVEKGAAVTTILLGANGRLGTILTHFAREEGLDWKTQARQGDADIIWSGDFGDTAADQVFQNYATIINFIGETGTDKNQLESANVEFVEQLLERAARSNVKHVILASSAAVYGAGDGTPFREADPTAPLNAYGQSKATMERVAETFAAINNAPKITIARIGNVAGADALIAAAQRHSADGIAMPLHRFRDGTASVRSYIGPYDFFVAIKALIPTPKTKLRTVNVVQQQPVSLDKLLSAYKDHLLPDLSWVDRPAPDGVPRSVVLSNDTLQNIVKLKDYDDPADALGRQTAELPNK
ncbi:NAD-dependent epimerase/dehydratase family protein [Octadecabacter sp. CECT 8868]|uniref:NAD-dependent epimerase/dehydratase family protein n=1 Tax=Octadecabacter algicola TaxID=2909342 RepID=UPI001F268AB7|nr:NAD-dependent epimerase/dehydratase family protein [Octadecabacter algicola]MCF2906222.1 NAD-dependent epimerase/dehydratase family protein [Octadecabacter algicola]